MARWLQCKTSWEFAEKERREAILARDEADRRAEAVAERYSDEIAALEERLGERFGERLENALQDPPAKG